MLVSLLLIYQERHSRSTVKSLARQVTHSGDLAPSLNPTFLPLKCPGSRYDFGNWPLCANQRERFRKSDPKEEPTDQG